MSVDSKVDTINMRLTLVVDNMRSTFATASPKITQDELKRMDPTLPIPIPDPRRELADAKEEINAASSQLIQNENFRDATLQIPDWMTSYEKFQRRKKIQVFTICLMLHMIGVYVLILEGYYTALDAKDVASLETALLQGIMNIFAASDSESRSESSMQALEQANGLLQTARPVLIVCAEVYILSILQIGIVYGAMTTSSASIRIVSQQRETLGIKINLFLRESGIVFLRRDILEFRMSRVRTKLLQLIHVGLKLDMLLATQTSPPTSKSSGSSPTSGWSLFGTTTRSASSDSPARSMEATQPTSPPHPVNTTSKSPGWSPTSGWSLFGTPSASSDSSARSTEATQPIPPSRGSRGRGLFGANSIFSERPTTCSASSDSPARSMGATQPTSPPSKSPGSRGRGLFGANSIFSESTAGTP
jgi:hypothetical protein